MYHVKRLWRDYSLSITAGVLFLVTWLAYGVVEWFDYQDEVHRDRQTPTFSGFLTRFFAFTLENWQSEFLHIFLLVLLTAYLVHKGSAESRDSDDEIKESLRRIEERLGEMEDRYRR